MPLPWFGFLLLLVLPRMPHAQPLIQHEMRIALQPTKHHLQATDTITLPHDIKIPWRFFLHAGLHPVSRTAGVQLVRQPVNQQTPSAPVTVRSYTVTLPPNTRTFVLDYAGKIDHPLPQSVDARSYRTTPGTITADGIFLSASTYWYPQADDALLTFTLDIQLPPAWDAVSQGRRSRHEHRDDVTHVRWESAAAQEQMYLVAGKYIEYHKTSGPISVMAFLRTPDTGLAQTYLDATAQYVAMYNKLIGPYPYTKFARVENFWESGYGMPSFTLLGSKVIRFPFILHSSYPHEILHNWWGNSVFVDGAGGNWSEGLTAYLADHLIREQRGTAVGYRRTTLQTYTDYVARHQDFPLTAFRARHNAVTQAVGYGKALMVFHMLRQQMGDEAFTRGLQAFYHHYRFQRAAFDDLIQVLADTAGIDPQSILSQWITRPGAPELRVSEATVRSDGSVYVLTAVVEQVQSGPAYRLHLPIAVSLGGQEEAFQTTVVMRDKRLTLALRLPARPLRLDVDPQFDIFRRLHAQEIPPALTQLFGAERLTMILPAAAPEEIRQGYWQLANAWQRMSSGQFAIRWDDELTALPTDHAVWLCGWENRWRSHLTSAVAGYDLTMQPDGIRIGKTDLQRATHAVVLTTRHPSNPQQTIAWIATDNPAALPGLTRKLPHYGKYSYLGFSGDAPTNIAKGQWPVIQSPMAISLSQADDRAAPVPIARLQARQALAAALPPPGNGHGRPNQSAVPPK